MLRVVVSLLIAFAISFSHGRSLASIRKDAFTVGINKSDSVAEYDFISEITKKMKIPRFRLVVFETANAGQKLLLEGKIDAIISKINYSPSLESKFLVSIPYGKTELCVATLNKNNEIWTLANLNEKSLAFVPKYISSEQILSIWQNSKPIAAQNLNDAINLLKTKHVVAIIADKQALEMQGDSILRIFPNKLAENNIVALFAPGSIGLQEEFNKSVASENSVEDNKARLNKAVLLLNELKQELELLQEKLK
jgi:ABC-type amino acid transport substrate-binding protein